MKKRLLNEQVTRRMMKLADIDDLTEDFIKESVELEEEQEAERGGFTPQRRSDAEFRKQKFGIDPAEDEDELVGISKGRGEVRGSAGTGAGGALNPYHAMARRAVKAKRPDAAFRADVRAGRAKSKDSAQNALSYLIAAARKDPDAQAILDAVYKENPGIRPRKSGLSPEERRVMDLAPDDKYFDE